MYSVIDGVPEDYGICAKIAIRYNIGNSVEN